MTSPASITSLASRVSASRGTLSQKNRDLTNNSNKANTSWKGETSDGFKDAHKKTQSKMTQLINDLGILQTKLNSLANAVKQAKVKEALDKVVR